MKQLIHDEYLATEHWWFRARRRIFERLLDATVALPESARILDIGPGSGINLPVLAPRGRVAVLDLSLRSLQQCRAAGAEDTVLGDAVAPPLAPGSVDLIAALDVLEHLADDAAALRAWHALLAPGGRLLLSVPALPILWGRQDVLSDHHRRYRRRELRDALIRAGFAIERLSYFNAVLLPPILAVRLAMRPFLGGMVARRGSDLSIKTFGLDRALYRLFAAESGWLRRRNLPLGVSLLAIARPS